jgi:hypothetical protein
MAAILIISFYDDTHEEIEFNEENGKYWKPTMQGLMIKTNGVRGSRTVYPWSSIRKYHIETEVGQRDRERLAEERAQQDHSSVGGRGDVHEQADPGV